ncbi:uncharacterized protein BCR38DRAFT_431817 [Pseudomassariella vexata]|uniref:Uncharacterized protein n=1 Tax=Pseudomassariella vexata TaxID=1141098 RepID=A0A1Y2E0L4_9PEZI|nr:uncharacterized protein BCR38DRAFT_431817 [Pseudomassariella vexata]ORY65081.1 hypothetical protein BCR38DRAFT_431817 [Pseudomassariella vexata]
MPSDNTSYVSRLRGSRAIIVTMTAHNSGVRMNEYGDCHSPSADAWYARNIDGKVAFMRLTCAAIGHYSQELNGLECDRPRKRTKRQLYQPHQSDQDADQDEDAPSDGATDPHSTTTSSSNRRRNKLCRIVVWNIDRLRCKAHKVGGNRVCIQWGAFSGDPAALRRLPQPYPST